MKPVQFPLAALLLSPGAAGDLNTIPTAPFTAASPAKFYDFENIHSIIVDAKYASAKDEQGSTLIPPTLLEFANTFAKDLKDVHGYNIPVKQGSSGSNAIYLTIDKTGKYLDAAGRPTSEGYTLTTNSSGVFIEGASPLGAWWGTRTVLQQATINNADIDTVGVPYGRGQDSPGWATRGMMLDGGRAYYSPSFIKEICSYMSYFKQNVFHLHLSDNLNTDPKFSKQQTDDLGAWFRLWSDNKDLAGLSSPRNESYTREQFDDFQSHCASRGVTVLPEIEAPGHALRIVRWRPQIAYPGDQSLLNIKHKDTLPSLQLIWKEFLPWFKSKVVSIGADEYTGPAEDYNYFVNEMNKFIKAESGKAVRIWGTFPPKSSYKNNISKDVSVQHWEYFEDNPLKDYIQNGYDVANSNDNLYVVSKWSASYPQHLDIKQTFHSDPANNGPWYPNILNQKKVSDNAAKDEKRVLGAIAPIWNDFGPNATTQLESYYAWRDSIPAFGDKYWGGSLTADAFDKTFSKLIRNIPAQNLDRHIESKGTTILDYSFASGVSGGVVRDTSGNEYHGETKCRVKDNALQLTSDCSLDTPLSSKGRDYTLTMVVNIAGVQGDANDATLVEGRDTILKLTPNLTFNTNGNYYRTSLAVPRNEWVEIKITGNGDRTYASVARVGGNANQEEFKTKMGIHHESIRYEKMALEAPLDSVNGWKGQLRSFKLENKA
ncbi:hypothetical protein VHEMI08310 [[Torrubiella] hemipterigena]|uniref:beta-N-acetylhexosaminidase n=1 Tax=[Torrubiella] hemipterigena TaxID=1531966 RepID=A0A0A1T6F5_9HYPO|nr:hypothetical protein VHEMI08310 [[Torrubiella] hemipterigena]